MSLALARRGPDGEGTFADAPAGVWLAHRRLAIIDLAGGAQPMATSDGALVVTYNGEIYNHAALREELTARGHRFVTSHCDTEVLLHGWREWGEDLPRHLNGMAAGLPVVATAIAGNEELVIPGQTGLLVPPDDPDALAAALARCLADAALCRAFGQAGRDRVVREYAWGQVAQAYLRCCMGPDTVGEGAATSAAGADAVGAALLPSIPCTVNPKKKPTARAKPAPRAATPRLTESPLLLDVSLLPMRANTSGETRSTSRLWRGS